MTNETNGAYGALRSNVSKGANRSKYFEMLEESERLDVLEFVHFMTNETKLTNNTINSYKSYVCKALVSIKSGTKLTNDQKSAIRLFLSFLDKRDK